MTIKRQEKKLLTDRLKDLLKELVDKADVIASDVADAIIDMERRIDRLEEQCEIKEKIIRNYSSQVVAAEKGEMNG